MTKNNGNTLIQETVDTTRRFAEDTTMAAREAAERGMTMNRHFIEAWTTSTEVTMKAAFDLQNAAMTAGMSLIKAADNTNKVAFEQWTEMVRHAQEATLEAWRASQRIGDQFRVPTKPHTPTGH